ncbi:carbohydrate ABC transporter permease [Paenibacillus sp. HB172176]|uniref:carbohydrate ABC transporter permease n=1 Tax=Paenibacillus sp. HB172176 TaxID=2493690 RepID=UPI0014389D45|nr:carbohydrate ABC transporter permease [Paenibacillus sp. HB172176]
MNKPKAAEMGKHAFLIVVCLFVFYPLLIMLQMSFKDVGQIIYAFFKIEPPFHLENYSRAWKLVHPMIGNSLIISCGTALLAVVIASLAGYAFGRLRFPGKESIFWIIFAKLFLPGVLNLVPAFVLAWKMGLLDTYWAVILFGASAVLPFWVFVVRTFVQQQPQELFECAKIDGANEIQTFVLIAVPLLKPMITLLMINVFISEWNNYIWPLVTLTSPDKRPITVGLAYLTSSFPGDYGALMAGYTIATLPLLLLFIFGMKQFVQGLTSGAIKI